MPSYHLQNISYIVDRKALLNNINLEIKSNQRWVILGPNGCGKTLLARILNLELEPTSGKYLCSGSVKLVSFEKVTEIINHIRYNDNSNSAGGYDQGITVQQYLFCGQKNQHHANRALETFDLSYLMKRGLKFLSTGEMRKVVIAKALLDNPDLLILDEPFDGLDRRSYHALKALIEKIADQGIIPLLCLNRFEEIPQQTTHIALIESGAIVQQGDKERILNGIQSARRPLSADKHTILTPAKNRESISHANNEIVAMKNVSVSYRNQAILSNINWTVYKGQNWLITGPNGCGKTTLLQLITGDNPQAYANDITLFGQKKGSGENLWDIKKRIGYISTSLHREYRVGGTVLSVVLSGLFDSIGVYDTVSAQQRNEAVRWLELIGLVHKKTNPFRELSFGQQRIVLIARAMIKRPEVLILDEPCQGLDENSRNLVLDLADGIGRTEHTQIFYVTHRPEDRIPCMTHHLQFKSHPAGGYSTITEKL